MSYITILIAPSKTMDFTTSLPFSFVATEPPFVSRASQINVALAKKTVKQIMTLMHVSQPIAEKVIEAVLSWDSANSGKAALWAYRGDVYKGIKAYHLSKRDAEWAQNNLLILSGLYGLVRPYDGIQAYRLEMQSKLNVSQKKNIYEFWGEMLAAYVSARNSAWICNLSSDEYARAVLKYIKASETVITPVFYDRKPSGVVSQVPIYSKMMRGVMAHWMITKRIDEPRKLEAFAEHGYQYRAPLSRPGFPAFYRSVMKPLVF